MFRSLVDFCLRFRGVVIALACVVLVYGIEVARSAKLDVFPEFVPPQVVVQTEAPGLAAEQVEMLVTTPVEAAISGLGHLNALRSESIQGLSVVTVVFEEGTDVYHDRQLLAERLAGLSSRLPLGVRPPTCRRSPPPRWTCSRSASSRIDSRPWRCAPSRTGRFAPAYSRSPASPR